MAEIGGCIATVVAAGLTAGLMISMTVPGTVATASPPQANWSGAWQSSPSGATYPPVSDQSFRTMVHPSTGGRAVRITLSNRYGTAPVVFDSVSVALRDTGASIRPGTSRPVTFGEHRQVTLAPGASASSDPVPVSFGFGDDLAVSYHVPGTVARVTGSGVTAFDKSGYLSAPGAGDHTGDATGAAFPVESPYVSFLTRVDAEAPETRGAVVTFGDSITEGTESGQDTNADYPSQLAGRIHAARLPLSVVNGGIAGNTLLPCGTAENLFGQAAVDRFTRDALTVPGVTAVIISEGGNDLRYCGRSATDLEAALRHLVDTAHAAGLKVLLGTYIPRVSHTVLFPDLLPDSLGDDQRRALNTWIRAQRDVTVVDFDHILATGDGSRQRPETGSLDQVHPGPAGYKMMAEAVPLDQLPR